VGGGKSQPRPGNRPGEWAREWANKPIFFL
jgi:hypothetical protein